MIAIEQLTYKRIKMHKITLYSYFILLSLISFTNAQQPIPSHPTKLKFDSLHWQVPSGQPFRTTLKNGLRAYVATDSILPLVQITGYVRNGSILDPTGKEGLATLTTSVMRSGGTKRYLPDSLDDLIDLMAINVSVSASESALQFNMSFLAEQIDTALYILNQILFYPRFDKSKFERERSIFSEALQHQFDNPGPTLDVAFQKLMYPKQAAGSIASPQTLKNISISDLQKLHARAFRSKNIIIAAAGKFNRDKFISKLETLFPSDTTKSDSVLFPITTIRNDQSLVIVHKNISQVYIRLGVPLFKRPNDDYYPVSVLNMILGGGGFTSRLGTKIRSDEGLTYSIYSNAESNYTFPGTWYIDFFTKTESLPRALELSVNEINKIIEKGVTETELANARSSLIGELPSMFRSPFDIVSTYAWNEYYGRSPEHFIQYPEKLQKITLDDLKNVAKKYLSPKKMSYALVIDTVSLRSLDSSKLLFQSVKNKSVITTDKIPTF